MKKICIYIISFLLIFSINNVKAVEFNLNSTNAILYNLNDDTVLFDKGGSEKVSIASLTKITTAIVAIENIKDIDEKVTLTNNDFKGLVEANAAVAGFHSGQEVTYRDLLYGLLYPSGADAAQAIANNVAGSNEKYVELMNKKKDELKLKSTHYENTIGLDHEEHYSSIEDVAKVFKYALKNKTFKEILNKGSYTTSDGNLTFKSPTEGRKKSLSMEYLQGGKTGTTDNAGSCLATIAKENGVNYMLITVGAPISKSNPLNFLDAKEIYEYFMNNYSYKNVLNKKDVLVTLDTLYAKKNKVKIYSTKKIDMYLDNEYKKENLVYKYKGKKIVTLDMDKGTKLGKIYIYYKGRLLTKTDVVLNEKQKLDIIKYIYGHKIIVLIVLFIILLIIMYIRRVKNGKRKTNSNRRRM